MISVTADLPNPCIVPTSELGQRYGAGRIVSAWRNVVAVDFSGHLAHLTVSRHQFLPVSA